MPAPLIGVVAAAWPSVGATVATAVVATGLSASTARICPSRIAIRISARLPLSAIPLGGDPSVMCRSSVPDAKYIGGETRLAALDDPDQSPVDVLDCRDRAIEGHELCDHFAALLRQNGELASKQLWQNTSGPPVANARPSGQSQWSSPT